MLVILVACRLEHRKLYFSLFDAYSSSYYRPQQFNVVLDTGSSDLWLAGPSFTCTNSFCQNAAIFQTSQSTSFKTVTSTNSLNSEVSIAYGSGSVTGTLGSDTVTMGGFTIDAQTLRNYPYRFFGFTSLTTV